MITCTFKQISIADLFNGFVNNEEEGVYTYIRIDGELIKTDIRPPYQREFVYSDEDVYIDSLTIENGTEIANKHNTRRGIKNKSINLNNSTNDIADKNLPP